MSYGSNSLNHFRNIYQTSPSNVRETDNGNTKVGINRAVAARTDPSVHIRGQHTSSVRLGGYTVSVTTTLSL